MATLEELVVKIEANSAGLRADLAKVQKTTEKSSKKMRKSLADLATKGNKSFFSLKRAAETMVGFIGGRVVFAAFNKAKQAASALFRTLVTDGVKAAQVQEDAINQLNIALVASGKFSKATSQELQDYASSLQRTTKFGDETILQTQALIQSLGQLDKEALKTSTAAALDLAAALGIDLKAAALLVGKAATGEISSFSRYGLIIEKGATNSETFANALESINTKFGGAAAGQIKTFSGASQQLSNTFGDLTEEIGFVVTENSALAEVISVLDSTFSDLGSIVKDNRKFLQELVADGIITLAEGIPLVVDGLGTMVDWFSEAKKGAAALTGGLASLVGADDFAKAQEEAFIEEVKRQEERQAFFAKTSKAAKEMRDRIVEAAKKGGESSEELNRSLAAQNEAMQAAKGSTIQLTDAQKAMAEEGAKFSEQLLADAEMRKVAAEEQQLLLDEEKISIEEFHIFQVDQLSARLEQEKDLLAQAQEAGKINEKDHVNALLQIRKKHAIDSEKVALDFAKREDAVARDRTQAGKNALNDLASFQNAKSKELAAVGKAAAISSTVIASIESAQLAFKSLVGIPLVGIGLATAASAAALAAGAGRVAAIRGTPLQGGIDSVPGIGTQDIFPAILAPKEKVLTGEQNKDLTSFLKREETRSISTPQNIVNLIIQGSVFDSKETGMQIIDMLNEAGFATGAVVTT